MGDEQDGPRQGKAAASAEDVAGYIASQLEEFVRHAEAGGFETLAHLLKLAREEAARASAGVRKKR